MKKGDRNCKKPFNSSLKDTSEDHNPITLPQGFQFLIKGYNFLKKTCQRNVTFNSSLKDTKAKLERFKCLIVRLSIPH